jgi:hypothetical protein
VFGRRLAITQTSLFAMSPDASRLARNLHVCGMALPWLAFACIIKSMFWKTTSPAAPGKQHVI